MVIVFIMAFVGFFAMIIHGIFKHTFYYHWSTYQVEDNINLNPLIWIINFIVWGTVWIASPFIIYFFVNFVINLF